MVGCATTGVNTCPMVVRSALTAFLIPTICRPGTSFVPNRPASWVRAGALPRGRLGDIGRANQRDIATGSGQTRDGQPQQRKFTRTVGRQQYFNERVIGPATAGQCRVQQDMSRRLAAAQLREALRDMGKALQAHDCIYTDPAPQR